MERALGSVGLHVSKGCEMWDAYREIENAILLTMQVSTFINIINFNSVTVLLTSPESQTFYH